MTTTRRGLLLMLSGAVLPSPRRRVRRAALKIAVGVSTEALNARLCRAGMDLGMDEAVRLINLLGRSLVQVGRAQDADVFVADSTTLSRLAENESGPSAMVCVGELSAPARVTAFTVAIPLATRVSAVAGWLARAHGITRWSVGLADSSHRVIVERMLTDQGATLVPTSERDLAQARFTGELSGLSGDKDPFSGWTVLDGPPDGAALTTVKSPFVWADEWSSLLVRYGASELNERFGRHFGEPMSSAAWRGWMAVKCAAEAWARFPDLPLTDALRQPRLDGHKGTLLRFDDRRILVQPLYVVGQGRTTLRSRCSRR
jgi:hypothetical protein